MNRRDFLLKSARAMISVAGSYLISTNPAIAKAIQQASVEDESQQQEASVYHFEGFNERVQAYIVARYYVRLKGAFGEQGLKVFQLATRTYAEQRGHRMAQQALADGQPLTIETYHRYGEWISSDECRRKGEDLQQQVIWDAPYYTFHVTRCPWSIQFRDMGLQEVLNASRVFALTAVDILTDAKLLQNIKAEFKQVTGSDFKYIPLLGDRKPALDYRKSEK